MTKEFIQQRLISSKEKGFRLNPKQLGIGLFLGVIVVLSYIILNPGEVARAANLVLDTTTANQIQVDVANRYRMIMTTNDTEDYIIVYDRAEDDATPDAVFEIFGSRILDEGSEYNLRYHDLRITTVLEATDTRIRVRVEGCFDSAAGGSCIKDVAGGDDDTITVIEEYTFTTDSIYSTRQIDFEDGLQLDGTGGNDRVTYNMQFNDVVTTAHSETILYGDGETEGTTAVDGDIDTDDDIYVVAQGTGSYQDIIFGALLLDGDKHISNSANAQNYYNLDADGGERDQMTFQELNTQTITGIGRAQMFISFQAQADLDTEVKREALFNNLTNPDLPVYTTGTEWDDATGSTSLGSPSSASPGLDFESGNSEYVYAADSASLSITGDMTVEAWIKPESVTAATLFDIAGKWDGANESYLLAQYGDEIRFYIDAAANYETTDAANLATGRWYHIAAIYDATAQTVTLYVNGVSEASTTSGTIPSSIGDDAGRFQIGAEDSTTTASDFYDGVVDEVRVWNDQRTSTEILDNMQQQVSSGAGGLVGYWKLNENTGTTTFDETSNDNDGTLVNSPTWLIGHVTDQYNEAEGVFTVDMPTDAIIANSVEVDLDAGANVSTLINDVTDVEAEATSITVDSTTGFLSFGEAYIEGDKFSYTGTTGTTFTGIPTSGDDALIGHADNAVVSLSSAHTPNYKFRNYRSSIAPTTVQMEGTEVTRGTDFNADVKPVTDAHFAQDLVFYASLDSTTVEVGTDLTNSGCSFVAAKYGQGLECDSDTNNANFSSTSNIDFTIGALEFWMQPKWDSDDGVSHVIVSAESDRLTFQKWSDDIIYYRLRDGTNPDFDEVVASGDFSWKANDWVHIRLEWDDTASAADQQKLFINGVEPTHTDSTGDYDGSLMSTTAVILGNYTSTGTNDECNCIIDEFKIYDFNGSGSNAALDQVAYGGNTGETNEYMVDDATNYTLSFAAVDASNRGEYAYFGSDSQFQGLNIDLATMGVGTEGSQPVMAWEYWNGTQWSTLAVQEDTAGVTTFKADGAMFWSAPGNWFPYSVNGSTDLYYIRGSLASGSYSTSPVESTIKTDILVLDYLSDLTQPDQTLSIPGTNNPSVIYHFDEGADNTCSGGEDACDASGNSNEGTFASAPVWTSGNCVSDHCLEFDGTDDEISVADANTLDHSASSFTVEGWFRHSGIATNPDVIAAKYEGTGSDGGWRLQMEDDGDISFGADDDNQSFPTDQAITTTANYDDNTWHHVAGVKNGTTDLTLYIDGVQIVQDTSISATGSLDNNDSMYIAVDGDGTSNNWDGLLDEFKIYPYARSAAEINRDFLGAGAVQGAAVSFGDDSNSNLQDGLVGWWQMDDAGIDTEDELSTDSSGNDNSGTLYGDDGLGDNGSGMDCTATGKFGSGCDFDATDDYVDFGDLTVENVDLTISAWVNPNTVVSDEGTILSKDSSGGFCFAFRTEIDGGLSFGTRTSSTTWKVTGGSLIDTETSTWQHVAVVYDESENDATIYVDGQPVANSAQDDVLDAIQNTSSVISSGRRPTGNDEYDGLIDEVRLYTRALSPAEVRQLYNWAPGPIAYYNFDENTGTSTVYDRSGNGNSGTMQAGMNESDWVPGKFGSSLDFDGTNDTVDIYSAGFNSDFSGDHGTVSVWLNFLDSAMWTDSTGYIALTLRGDLAQDDNDIVITKTSTDLLQTTYEADGIRESYNHPTPQTGWFNLAMSWDKAADEVKHYLNGVLQETDTGLGTWTDANLKSNNTVIGAYRAAGTLQPYKGPIDDVRIYNYARTPSQIIEDMNGGHPVGGSPIGSQVGWWKFDEGYGTITNDSGTGGNNGTFYGNTAFSTAGKFGRAVIFDGNQGVGTDTFIRLPNDAYNSHTEGTVSFWFNPDDTGDADQEMFSAVPDDNGVWNDYFEIIYRTTNNNIFFTVADEGTTEIGATSPTNSITPNSWQHLALTMNSSGHVLYINGKPITLSYADGDATVDLWFDNMVDTSPTSYLIGAADPDGSDADDVYDSELYEGEIDELKIYTAALTPDQILVDMNQGASTVLGSTGTTSGGVTDSSYAREFCVPGDASTCNAPVAHWLMNERGGEVTYDRSSNGITGTLGSTGSGDGNDPMWQGSNHCQSGSCLYFDGSDDYVTTATTSVPDHTATFSITAWVYASSTTGDRAIYCQDSGTHMCFYVDDGVLTFCGNSTCSDLATSNASIITTNTWHHVTVTYDGTTAVTFYVDGVDQTSDSTIAETARNDNAYIGGETSFGSYWSGYIDEVTIFDYERTAAQVAWEFNRGAPVGYWKLDECSGSTAYDSSLNGSSETNGNTGTITIGTSGTNTSLGTCSSGDSAHAWNNGTTGKVNSSLDFDGTDDYIDLGDVDFASDMTIAAWINPETLATDQGAIMAKYNNDQGRWAFRTGTDGALEFMYTHVTGCAGVCYKISQANDIDTDTSTWQHVVAVYTSADRDVEFYVDGKLVTKSTDATFSNDLTVGND